jgi:hypothetical protein
MRPLPYSAFDIVQDGALRAPRWLHHVVKLMTHMSIAFVLLAAGLPMIIAAGVAGPGVYFLIVVKELVRPSDPARYSVWEHVADSMTDGSIATLTLVAAMYSTGDRIGASLVFGACVGSYMAGRKDARP